MSLRLLRLMRLVCVVHLLLLLLSARSHLLSLLSFGGGGERGGRAALQASYLLTLRALRIDSGLRPCPQNSFRHHVSEDIAQVDRPASLGLRCAYLSCWCTFRLWAHCETHMGPEPRGILTIQDGQEAGTPLGWGVGVSVLAPAVELLPIP